MKLKVRVEYGMKREGGIGGSTAGISDAQAGASRFESALKRVEMRFHPDKSA